MENNTFVRHWVYPRDSDAPRSAQTGWTAEEEAERNKQKNSKLLKPLDKLILEAEYYLPFEYANPTRSFKDNRLEWLRQRKNDPIIKQQERYLKFIQAIFCAHIPTDSPDLYMKDRKKDEWKCLPAYGLRLNTGVLRDHVLGRKTLGFKKTSKTTCTAILKISGIGATNMVYDISDALHSTPRSEKPLIRAHRPSLVLRNDKDYYMVYGINDPTPVSIIHDSFEKALSHIPGFKDKVTILPDGETIMPLPLQLGWKVVNYKFPDMGDYIGLRYFSWEQIKFVKDSFITFPRIDSIVPMVDHRYVTQIFSPLLTQIITSPKLPKKKTTTDIRFTIYPPLTKGVPESFLEGVEKYIRNSYEFKNFSRPNMTKRRAQLNGLRFSLMLACYFYKAWKEDGKTEEYEIPSKLMKLIDSRYGPYLWKMFLPLFSGVIKNHTASTWGRRCRTFDMTKFRHTTYSIESMCNYSNEYKENKYILNTLYEYTIIWRNNVLRKRAAYMRKYRARQKSPPENQMALFQPKELVNIG